MAWIIESVRPISVGDWTFELRGDEISVVRFRGVDVLRSVRAVARDRDWSTPQWTITSVDETRDGVRIGLRTTELGSAFDASLAAIADGSVLEIVFEATSAVAFETNRTGLVVLHPPQLAGSEMRIAHPDGSDETASFPTDISPHQPAFDIRSLGWEHGGLRLRCDFAGDVFEMEDQRNWTDASYKTYSRPLALPFPYPIAAGETVRQSITVSAESSEGQGAARAEEEKGGRAARPTAADAARASRPRAVGREAAAHAVGGSPETLALDRARPMPSVSVGASTAPGSGPAPDPIGADLLVEIDLGWPGWPSALERAAQGGLPLDVRLVLPESGAEAAVAAAAASLAALDVARVGAFQPAGHRAQHVSDATAIALLRAAAAAAGLDAPVIGGARSHFTELNREHHRLPADLDGVAFSTTPMFHAFETLQVEQAVAMQRLVAEQAVRIADGAPVHVGPVTLRTHVNNVATTAPPRPSGSDLSEGYGPELLDADDSRQTEPELAAWLIASAAALSVPGVATLSYFEEWGPRGVRTSTGDDLPAAAAVRLLASLSGRPLQTAHTRDGLVWAMRAGETELVSNLSGSTRRLELDGAVIELAPRTWLRR